MGQRIFHYTYDEHYISILRDGEIKLKSIWSGDLRRPNPDKSERSAVWFSTNPDWEKSCDGKLRDGTTHYGLPMIEALQRGRHIYRIEVTPESAPYNWEDYKSMSGMSKTTIKLLEQRARQLGSDPREYRVSFQPVGWKQWVCIETLPLAVMRWELVRNTDSIRKRYEKEAS